MKLKTVTIPVPLTHKDIVALSEKEPTANLYCISINQGKMSVDNVKKYGLDVSYYADLFEKGEVVENIFYQTQREVEDVISALKET